MDTLILAFVIACLMNEEIKKDLLECQANNMLLVGAVEQIRKDYNISISDMNNYLLNAKNEILK